MLNICYQQQYAYMAMIFRILNSTLGNYLFFHCNTCSYHGQIYVILINLLILFDRMMYFFVIYKNQGKVYYL